MNLENKVDNKGFFGKIIKKVAPYIAAIGLATMGCSNPIQPQNMPQDATVIITNLCDHTDIDITRTDYVYGVPMTSPVVSDIKPGSTYVDNVSPETWTYTAIYENVPYGDPTESVSTPETLYAGETIGLEVYSPSGYNY